MNFCPPSTSVLDPPLEVAAVEPNGRGVPSDTVPSLDTFVKGFGFEPVGPFDDPQSSVPPGLLQMHTHYSIYHMHRGLNWMLEVKDSPSNKLISKVPTLIIGMDVVHPGSLWNSDSPPIAAVVHSRKWPQITEYRAYVQTLPLEEKMVYPLFYPESESNGKKKDSGIMWELLQDFYTSSGNQKPQQIIIFRYGVNESQMDEVLNAEVEQIKEACKLFDEEWSPKFVVIKLFENEDPRNGRSGTINDAKWEIDDLYEFVEEICSTRPSHYRVKSDGVGLSADDLQHVVDSLSYVHLLRTYPINQVAPFFLGPKRYKLEEERETKRLKTKSEPEEVNLGREREFISGGGEELALYVLGQMNNLKDGKHYELDRHLFDRFVSFGEDPHSFKKYQHVSMFARVSDGDNVPKKIIFAELCYSESDGMYESVKHSVLDPDEPQGIRYGCGFCFPYSLGPNISPHPADVSKFFAGHWLHPVIDPRRNGILDPIDSTLKVHEGGFFC